MKILIVTLLTWTSAISAQAGELDGKTFCRTVVSDGSFGQPRGEREHCVVFEEDSMTDTANTFFGNPPETIAYVLVVGKVLVVKDGKLESPYQADAKLKTLKKTNGVALNLK